MNIVASNHNRLLVGNGGPAPVEYSAGPNINITDHVISGKYWDDEIASAAADASAAAVDSAFDKTTAWVEDQNYLTAHQDVSNLPYVQNSALEFNGALISGISGSGFYAVSADLANSASESEHAISATVSQEAIHAGSADLANTADSAHVADYAISAEKLVNGYRGIAPIVVDNDEMIISAQSAKLGVQGPLYFVEDTSASTVIGIHDSAFPEFGTTQDGQVSSVNGSAIHAATVTEYSAGNNIDITDYVISVTGSVPSADRAISAYSANYATESNHTHSADSATYDSLGRKIVDTYLTAHQDWTNTIQNASGNAYNSAVQWVVDQHYLTTHQDVSDLPYVQNTALESNGILISGISGSGLYATSADNAFEADHAYEADYVLSGWEYDENNRISAYNGSAFAGQGGQGIEYEGISPIVVNNVEHKISAQSARLGVQEPLYFVEDSNTATVIGISGLPEVEGVMYESGLGIDGGYITSYNNSAFSAERAGYAVSATSANGAVSSQTANYVVSGWGLNDGQITSYNGSAIAAGAEHTQVPVSGTNGIGISKPGDTVLISVTGQYIPYTNITTGDSGTTCYNVAKGIRVTATDGWSEMYSQNNENAEEAHLQVGQNYTGNSSFWAELDGADGGFLQMNWNSGYIAPNQHDSYVNKTTAALYIFNGAIHYCSADHNITAGGGGENECKIWQLGSQRLRFWDNAGNVVAVFGSAEYNMLTAMSSIISQYSAHWVLN